MSLPTNPITRKERYLAKIAGQGVTIPAYPLTREESYLDAIAKNGSGGASYEIKGAYDTEEELKTAHPTGEAGDAYLVGDPSHVYVWLTEESEWSDAGEFTAIEGPQGPKGDKGDKGDSGAPTVITYEQWQELTPEQQASGNYIVQDWPTDEEGESVTGNPLSFTTDSEQTARSTLITFEPIQAGSGDPSPENVREISGYDKVELAVPRKNLLNCNCKTSIPSDTAVTNTTPRKFESDTVVYGLARTNYYDTTKVSNIVKSADSISGTSDNVYGVGFVKLLSQATTYTLSFTAASGTNVSIAEYKKDGTYVKNIANVTSPYQYTTNAQEERVSIIVIDGNGGDFNVSNLQLELGSTVTTYEPYNPVTDITLNLPETVYGGTLDVESGELTVTHKYRSLNGTEIWSVVNTGTSNWYYKFNIDDLDRAIRATIISDKYKSVDISDTNTDKGIANTAGTIRIREDSEDTVGNFKARLASNPVQVCYELATPYTLRLTPHQVRLLLGSNVVTTNGTSIALMYRNGEIASLADVDALAGSVEALAEQVTTRTVATITGDGVKTAKQLLDELYTYYAALTPDERARSYIEASGYVYLSNSTDDSNGRYVSSTGTANNFVHRVYFLRNNNSVVSKCTISASGNTLEDQSSSTPTTTYCLKIR